MEPATTHAAAAAHLREANRRWEAAVRALRVARQRQALEPDDLELRRSVERADALAHEAGRRLAEAADRVSRARRRAQHPSGVPHR